MIFLSINCCGLKSKGKVDGVRELVKKERCNLLAIQETKCENFSDVEIRNIWGKGNSNSAFGKLVGASGGTLLIWDTNCFKKQEITGLHFCGVFWPMV